MTASLVYDNITVVYITVKLKIMKTVLNVKVDKDQKKKAKKIAERMGVPLSTVMNAYLREFIRTERFEIDLEPKLKPEVEEEILSRIEDYEGGKNIVSFRSVEEARKYFMKK